MGRVEHVRQRPAVRAAVRHGHWAYLNSVPDSLAMIRDTRQPTAQGNRAAGAVLYCYDTTKGVNGQEVEGDTALFAALPQQASWRMTCRFRRCPGRRIRQQARFRERCWRETG